MRECEGAKGCVTTWKFSAKRKGDDYLLGSGVSSTGERTALLLKAGENHSVVIVSSNAETNERVVYTGTEDNDGIAGKFHSDNNEKTGNWYAQPIKDIERPQKIKYCGPMACHNLVLTDRNYVSVDDRGNPSGTKWTVEQFSAEGVKIERQDPPAPNGSAGYRATLTGRILASGERIEGEQDGSFGPAKVRFVMTWGSSYPEAQPTGANPPQPGQYSTQLLTQDNIRLWTQIFRFLANVAESNN